ASCGPYHGTHVPEGRNTLMRLRKKTLLLLAALLLPLGAMVYVATKVPRAPTPRFDAAALASDGSSRAHATSRGATPTRRARTHAGDYETASSASDGTAGHPCEVPYVG